MKRIQGTSPREVLAGLRRREPELGALLVADLAAMATASFFGPFVLAPGLLAIVCLITIVGAKPGPDAYRGGPHQPRLYRAAAVALAVASFLGPIALEIFGLVPPSIAFTDGALVLLPPTLAFPPGPTLAFLAVTGAALIVVPSLVVLRVRDLSFALEKRAFERLSCYRQLLPSEVRECAGPLE